MLAYITGSGFYDHPAFSPMEVATRFGDVTLYRGDINGHPTLLLPRHGKGHRDLPHQINHRAHFSALKQAGATAVISCSVCGLLRADWPLATPLLATDLYFPDNRLGDGSACTLFTEPGEPGRGHLLVGSLCHSSLIREIDASIGTNPSPMRGTYAHVPGPRFNTRTEIRALQAVGCDFLSQTCGPEAVLSNELELPYSLLGFGIDYANGVSDSPTPVETLSENLGKAKTRFTTLIETFSPPENELAFENFVYRF
ncbi:MAG: MTAP family purine nucleoside phosphorylase [Kiritimatiellae bacterium]|jgi:5'-methylthioadenosine phosphorylase|nr:MTAP family purine nucleoside phosphorylase [Kiritimatiellia bacterium]